MAIQIFPERRSIGELLGTGLGAGLSQSLQQLAQQKVGQLAQRGQRTQTQSALESLGIPAETAAGISSLPQNLQVEYIKNMRRQQQQQALSQALGTPQVEGAGPTAQDRGVANAFGGAEIGQQQQVQLAAMQQRKELAQKKLEQQERLHKQRLSAKDQEQVDKETFKAYESIGTSGEDARNKIPLVEEFIRISLDGDPGAPASNTMREVLGNFAFGEKIPKDWIFTDDATMQKKLSAQLVKLTLEKMKGRKSVEVLKAIRQTFPNVYQNRGAQLSIAKTLLYEYKMNDLRDRLQDRLIEENGGRRPRNFKSLVEKLARRLEPAVSKKYLPNLSSYKTRIGEVV